MHCSPSNRRKKHQSQNWMWKVKNSEFHTTLFFFLQALDEFLPKCQQKLTNKLEEQKSQANTSKNASNCSDYDPSYSKPKYLNGFVSKPSASSTPVKSCLRGVDTGAHEPSPIHRRMEKLQSYGEPPPVPPLLTGCLDKFKTKFKVPLKGSGNRSELSDCSRTEL